MKDEVCMEEPEGYLAKGVMSMSVGEEMMGLNMGRRDTERKHF